jgi:catechol 2,3-dioxygenase-like lactoylglutathione lyase family enzyme
MNVVRVRGLDHVVLVVADVERSLTWYIDELGGRPVRLDEWRAGEVLFPSVRLSASSIIDLVQGDRSGQNIDHLCLEIDPTDLDAIAASGRFDVVGGPADLFGARGMGRGLYVRDPDGNVVELRYYDEANST